MEEELCNHIFVECFLKDWKNLDYRETDLILKRQRHLNQKFIFFEEHVLKLRKLNNKLAFLEDRAKTHHFNLIENQEKLVKDMVIDDYEVQCKISLWNENYYTSIHPDFEGNPFYADSSLFFLPENDPLIPDGNWNTFSCEHGHLLKNEHFCHTFHHVYDHLYLAWEDILRIDDVWIGVVVNNQFFSNPSDGKYFSI